MAGGIVDGKGLISVLLIFGIKPLLLQLHRHFGTCLLNCSLTLVKEVFTWSQKDASLNDLWEDGDIFKERQPRMIEIT